MSDGILHITLADGFVRGLLVTATQTVQRARDIHGMTPVVTAALGRALMGTAMLGAMLKGDGESVTVTIDGGGPVGKLLCVADRESVRGVADVSNLLLPLRDNGKLNVGMAVGKKGRLSVVKDLGLKAPYIGQTELVSGEIAEDLANYFVQSEQSPSLCSLGVLVADAVVLAAGGVLLQPLPGCPDDVIAELELRSPIFGDVSHELAHEPMPSLMARWFDGLKPVVLEETPLAYRCRCSRERMEKALVALGADELRRMIEDEVSGAELCCNFCRQTQRFTIDELTALLRHAVGEPPRKP